MKRLTPGEVAVVIAAGLAGLLSVTEITGVTSFIMQPRGIRNHNPGNIRKNSTPWLGLSPEQTDAAFFQFIAPVYGIRAIARILSTYRNNHGLKTIAGIVDRWAPPIENNTASYIANVAQVVGIDANQIIDAVTWSWILPELIGAIIKHENGRQPYSLATIGQGVALA